MCWSNAYNDSVINGFTLPQEVNSNQEYQEKLELSLNQYKKYLKRTAFVYQSNLLEKIDEICDVILDSLNLLIAKDKEIADSKIKKMIEGFITDPFLVSYLDSSYSFRGLAPFIDFQSEGYCEIYQQMKREELTFFRARTPKKEGANCNIAKIEDILHLPFSKRNNASAERFSVDGVPCLYLGTTTYVCSQECNWNEDKYLYAAVFVPNEYGKKFKIFNLTISQNLINGINPSNKKSVRRQQLQNSFIKIFPLVIATSFRILRSEKEEKCIKEMKEVKYEYLISQALMRVLKELGIDGIAYLSMKGKNGLQYPIGVNIAFPAFDISEDTEYSKICKGFEVSKPIKFSGQKEFDSKSYINKVYPKYNAYGRANVSSWLEINGSKQYYGDTFYGLFDNFLKKELRNKNN